MNGLNAIAISESTCSDFFRLHVHILRETITIVGVSLLYIYIYIYVYIYIYTYI